MKAKEYAALAEEYQGRLGRFVRLEETTVRESSGSLANDTRRAQEFEATSLLAAIPEDAFVILLEVTGEMVSSEELAERIRRRQDSGTKTLCFVVGGHSGVAESVKRRADWQWSLSKLTFTHEMARVLLAEQVYRAFTILNNFPYSK
ncbi:MAG: 23S rRNA (pseudouridine(1915)-N(3))-methyltransferase RlmH [Blastocatellia bacterium]|nr:23S rRNA (pseudouridine(1915)-N(3))-methyltransferase RlmH [Blastocatellia bacterium]